MTERQFRIFSAVLLLIPFALLADVLIRPIHSTSGDLRELLYPLICAPILILFDGAWFHPQVLREIAGPFRAEGEPFFSTKNRNRVFVAIFIGGLIIFCSGCAIMGTIGKKIVDVFPTLVSFQAHVRQLSLTETPASLLRESTPPALQLTGTIEATEPMSLLPVETVTAGLGPTATKTPTPIGTQPSLRPTAYP